MISDFRILSCPKSGIRNLCHFSEIRHPKCFSLFRHPQQPGVRKFARLMHFIYTHFLFAAFRLYDTFSLVMPEKFYKLYHYTLMCNLCD